MKDINEMSERELLMELVVNKRNKEKLQLFTTAILAALLLVIVVALFIYVPKIMNIINEFNELSNQLGGLSEISSQLSELNESIQSMSKEYNFDMKQVTEFFENIKGAMNIFGLNN